MASHTDLDPVATFAVVLGAVMVIAIPAAAAHLAVWADMYGSILVYLAFLEYLAIAIALIRWGVGHWRL